MKRALAAAIIVMSLAVVVSTYRVFSQTCDEDVHISAGYQWLTVGNYDVDVEHPPLARILFGIDAWLTSPQISRQVYGWDQGNEILYRNGNYRRNLARARAGNLVFVILALVATGLWTRHLFGDAAALVAVALLGSTPAILGHGALATTDMAAAATTIAAAYAFALWIEDANWRTASFLAVAVALGLTVKFSFLVFFPIIAIVIALTQKPELALRRRIAHLAVVAIVSIASVWALYRFETGKINDARAAMYHDYYAEKIAAQYARQPGYEWLRVDLLKRFYEYARDAREKHQHIVDVVDWAKASGYPSPAAGRLGDTMAGSPPLPAISLRDRALEPFRASYQWFATHVDVPAPLFIAGAEWVRAHASMGHIAFLFGRKSDTGWWYYFPVILFFKSTLSFVVLSIAGIVLCRRKAIAFISLAMLIPPMMSSINIGVRHILPVYPFLAICGAYALVRIWSWQKSVAIALLAFHLFSVARAYPDYLAYFNEVAGSHPERIALDSNLDWGQDLLRLATVVRREKIPHLYIAYFCHADWRRHGMPAEQLPAGQQVKGWVAISEMALTIFGADGKGHGYEWLQNRTDYRRIGKSIRLYYIR